MEQLVFMVTSCGSSNFQLFICQIMAVFGMRLSHGKDSSNACSCVPSANLWSRFVLRLFCRSEADACGNQPLVPLVGSSCNVMAHGDAQEGK
jgi:hypothetical protein